MHLLHERLDKRPVVRRRDVAVAALVHADCWRTRRVVVVHPREARSAGVVELPPNGTSRAAQATHVAHLPAGRACPATSKTSRGSASRPRRAWPQRGREEASWGAARLPQPAGRSSTHQQQVREQVVVVLEVLLRRVRRPAAHDSQKGLRRELSASWRDGSGTSAPPSRRVVGSSRRPAGQRRTFRCRLDGGLKTAGLRAGKGGLRAACVSA